MDYLLYSYFTAMIVLVILHFTASGFDIHRRWSMYTHASHLLSNSGLCRLIYFAPKHFGSYRLYEVVIFFWCYVCNIVNTILLVICLVYSDMIAVAVCVNLGSMLIGYILMLVDTVTCDINNYRSKKFFKAQPVAEHEYCWAVDAYYKRNKTAAARGKCINYYKNYRRCNFAHIDEEYSMLDLDGVSIKCRTWPRKDLSKVLPKK